MTKKPIRWANIICHENNEPYLLIVFDGNWWQELPVTNCRVDMVKRTARDVFKVASKRILVSRILDGIVTRGGH